MSEYPKALYNGKKQMVHDVHDGQTRELDECMTVYTSDEEAAARESGWKTAEDHYGYGKEKTEEKEPKKKAKAKE